jgi:hypothetical protein
MTVIVSKPAVNLREELASLRNQGGYQEQQFYFDGLVTNGTFDTDTNWIKGTGWTISGGKATYSSATASQLQQVNVFEVGKTYKVYFDVATVSAGYVVFAGITATTAQTYTGLFTAVSTIAGVYAGANSNISIDNISVFETDGTDVVHRMPKGWVPKDVFEDGLLQREGSAHDYEVVYDGFDYYVKPTVAPSATTQTCVIGVKA